MARTINRLSVRTVQTIGAPGMHADGGGLYLKVEESGAKRWTFVFHYQQRRKEMGLGSILSVSLSRARELAQEARDAVGRGANPIEERRLAVAAQGLHTFGAMADALIKDLEPQWKSPVHRKQWQTTLQVDAAALRDKPIATITTEDVLGVLKPIWGEKVVTASKLRGRIERVLDAAKVKGLRTGENPARWRGHLALLLTSPAAMSKGHHPAMPFGDVPAYVESLRHSASVTARALEFTILCAKRTTEVIEMAAEEIDRRNKVWTIPAERMKRDIAHREALTDRQIEIIDALWPVGNRGFIFRSPMREGPLSNMAMLNLLQDAHPEFTVHGFRSSFQDWAEETTDFPEGVVEMQLAHRIKSKTRRAYRRGDALDKRRRLVEAWDHYCSGATATNVVPMRA